MTDFERAMLPLLKTRSVYKVWEDWVYMTAVAISNAFDFREERETHYKEIAAQYSSKELETLADLLAIVTRELDKNPEQDFLGSLYMQLNLGDHWKGQFFTPYHICQFMAKTIITENICADIDREGYFIVSDCACGAGATLIAAYHVAKNQLEKIRKNVQSCMFVAAQDISLMTACMCYIQLSLLGISAVIKVGDSLTDPICCDPLLLPHTSEYWFTPMYSFPVWANRRALAMSKSNANKIAQKRD